MSIVVLILSLLLSIALPNFVRARTTSRAQSCVAFLNEIDTAKNQYGIDNALTLGAPVYDAAALVPTYLEAWPSGPLSGVYAANPIGSDPTFNGENAAWYTLHCTGTTADASCPF
jgi:type II secretory pathway pseudopilin PulG